MKTLFLSKESIKNFLFTFFALFLLIFSNNIAKSAVSLSSPLCAGPFPDGTTLAPMHTLRYNCSVNVSGTAGDTYTLGVFVPTYTTSWVSGNGSSFDYTATDPLRYRFRADGPYQNGNSANITTMDRGSNVTLLDNAITTDKTYYFDLLYDTYEADFGDTSYSQPFTLGLYKTGDLPAISVDSSLAFTIADYLHIYKYTSPTVSVTPGLGYFAKNTYYEADQILIDIAVNNQWAFKVALSGNLSSGSDTASVADIFFKCSGSGFVNLATDFTQFVEANYYYSCAQNAVGEYTTGSTDGKSLNRKQIQIIYGFKNSEVYVPGSYTTTANYKLTTP